MNKTPFPPVHTDVKTLLKSSAIGILVVFGLGSCASDPYYGGSGNYSGQNVVPAIATGLAIAGLVSYANDRASYKRHRQWAYATGGCNSYYPARYRRGGHGCR